MGRVDEPRTANSGQQAVSPTDFPALPEEAIRATAIGSFNGSLASTSAIDLGATVIKAAIERAKIDSLHIDEVIMGNVLLFDPLPRRTEMRELDASVDALRRRYGNKCVVWGAQLVDEGAASVDAKADNTVHPVSFFHS